MDSTKEFLREFGITEIFAAPNIAVFHNVFMHNDRVININITINVPDTPYMSIVFTENVDNNTSKEIFNRYSQLTEYTSTHPIFAMKKFPPQIQDNVEYEIEENPLS